MALDRLRVLLNIILFSIGLLARLWRPRHFCIDRHRFCARWHASVGIDFLGGLIVRIKIFTLLNPQNLKFSAHFWTETLYNGDATE